MEGFTCNAVKNVVLRLMAAEELQGKIYVAGGILPYLYSGGDSGRLHSDLDIVADTADMPFVRQYLLREGLYMEELNSLCCAYNPEKTDYGIQAVIDGVPVSFAPFEVQDNNIVQRNFAVQQLAGYDALLKACLQDVELEDYVTRVQTPGGETIGAYTLEMVRCTKESTGREKDMRDLQEIATLPLDLGRYYRLKPAVQAMRVTASTPQAV